MTVWLVIERCYECPGSPIAAYETEQAAWDRIATDIAESYAASWGGPRATIYPADLSGGRGRRVDQIDWFEWYVALDPYRVQEMEITL